MSEFNIIVVKLGKVGKHPNANALSITHILGNYPIIFKTGDFKEGDLAVYIPIDSIISDNDKEFDFLGKHRRIKARRLRGIFSMGLLMPLRDKSWVEGQNVQNEYRIIKYEPIIQANINGENESTPDFFRDYTDIEGLRKWSNILQEGEEIIIIEKIHGTSAKFLYKNGRLWAGSHHCIKKENKDNLYWKIAYQYNFPELLKTFEDYILYGEIYGNSVQKGFDYGCKNNEQKLTIFDIFDIREGRYLNYIEYVELLKVMGLENLQPPVLYQGKWKEELESFAEGNSLILNANHVREGFVVRLLKERWDKRIGRVILKYIGEGYYLRKEKN